MMGACSGFAGSAGGLCGAVVDAPLTAPRPAPRFTVHKDPSLQERLSRPVPPVPAADSGSPYPGPPSGASSSRHNQRPERHFMIWVTLIGRYHIGVTRLAEVWVQRTQGNRSVRVL